MMTSSTMMQNELPYYAVIFTSKRSRNESEEYHATAERMVELAKRQAGFIGVESVRGPDNVGITVSYWKSEEAIRQWKENAEHIEARSKGRTTWYEWFNVRICKIEREYSFAIR